MGVKRPFDIGTVIRRVRRAVRPYPKAALFELAGEGFSSPFEQLAACIISIRTTDEATLPTARRLFERARTPLEVSRLTPAQIDELIGTCSFHERKARQIHGIARRVVEEFGGELPCDFETLVSFKGVGPKCANLVYPRLAQPSSYNEPAAPVTTVPRAHVESHDGFRPRSFSARRSYRTSAAAPSAAAAPRARGSAGAC